MVVDELAFGSSRQFNMLFSRRQLRALPIGVEMVDEVSTIWGTTPRPLLGWPGMRKDTTNLVQYPSQLDHSGQPYSASRMAPSRDRYRFHLGNWDGSWQRFRLWLPLLGHL